MGGVPSIEVAVDGVLLQHGLSGSTLSRAVDGLRLDARWGGSPLVLRLLRLPPPPATFERQPDPYFALLTAGEAGASADSWGIVRRGELTAQVAAGPGWVTAAGPIAPAGAYAPLVGDLFAVLSAVFPRPGSWDRGEPGWPFAALDAEGPAGGYRGLVTSGTGLTAASGAVALAGAFAPDLLPLALTAAGSLLPAGLLLLGVGWAARRAVARDLAHGDRVIRALRQSRLLDDVDAPRRLPPASPPVVPAGPEGRPLAAAHRCLVVTARATGRDLGIRLALHDVLWPEGAREGCVLLPRSWAAIEARGSGEALARLPTGPRETRGRGFVTWLLDAEELARDGLSDLLLRAEEALGAGPHGPYR